MGASSQKKVQQDLEQKYKPIRKYFDNFYGQITVIQNKSSSQKLVKIQKIMFVQKHIMDHIERRVNKSYTTLINIKQFYRFPVDMCSGNQMCIFLLDYHQATLYHQISKRQATNNMFTFEELVNLFYAMIQAAKTIMQIEAKSKAKNLISNSSFICTPTLQLKVLQSYFCSKNQQLQLQFPRIANQEQSQPRYYSYLCRKEKFKAKEIATNDFSFIFTLGMNFLECALLADLSQLYNKVSKQFEFDKLQEALQEVTEIYGDNIEKLISKMTQLSAARRPSLTEVEEYLKYIIQSSSIKIQEFQSFTSGTI